MPGKKVVLCCRFPCVRARTFGSARASSSYMSLLGCLLAGCFHFNFFGCLQSCLVILGAKVWGVFRCQPGLCLVLGLVWPWENDLSVYTVVAKKLHHGSNECSIEHTFLSLAYPGAIDFFGVMQIASFRKAFWSLWELPWGL